MFCRIVTVNLGGAGNEKTRRQCEPGPGDTVRGVSRALRIPEHSSVITALDSGDRAVAVGWDGKTCRDTCPSTARAPRRTVPSANGNDRIKLAGTSLANRRNRVDLLDRRAWWQVRRKNVNGRTLRRETVSRAGCRLSGAAARAGPAGESRLLGRLFDLPALS